MDIKQNLSTYDESYANEYDDTFLFSDWNKKSLQFQLDELKKLLANADTWLDIACGTGYVLSQFDNLKKAGIDLSPHMLEKARERNPNAEFKLCNYLDEHPDLNGKWDIITCMWWAYCNVETINDIRKLISNMAKWVSDKGVCFVPLCNPQKFDLQNIKIPYIDPKVPGNIMITGITWTWIQENGKRHDNVISPQVEHMVLMFKEFFHEVEVIEGPIDEIGEGWRVNDILIARKKKGKRSLDTLLSYDLIQNNQKPMEENLKIKKTGSLGIILPSLKKLVQKFVKE
jgi:SAM-dependent methyltransferase